MARRQGAGHPSDAQGGLQSGTHPGRTARWDHPVFSDSVNCFFKSTPQLVRECITYIQGDFAKHDLPVEVYPFVTPYEGQWWSAL